MTDNLRDNKKRIAAINDLIDEEVQKLLFDLDEKGTDVDGVIEILKDRVAQSDNPSYAIALARLYEIRLDTNKKRIDILKTLVVDKGNELNSVKKSTELTTQDILNGSMLGGMIGARIATDTLSAASSQEDSSILVEDLSSPEYIIHHLDITPTTIKTEVNKLVVESDSNN